MGVSIDYIRWVNHKKEEIDEFFDIDNPFGDYFLPSLSLKSFLPELSENERIEFIKKVKLNQSLASYDLYNVELIENLEISAELCQELKNDSHIIVTYHSGSYRQLLIFLMKNNIQYKLVTDSKFIEEQGEEMYRIQKELTNKWGLNLDLDEFEIINAEEPKSFFKYIHALKNNINLIFYLDGNKGVSKNEKNNESESNLLKVAFYNYYFYGRIGIGYLSYLANKPILPVLNSRTERLDTSLVFFNKIIPNKSNGRKEEAKRITMKLYEILEKELKKDLTQWEGWLYIHHFTDMKVLEVKEDIITEENSVFDEEIEIVFNKERYGIVKLSTQNILFDKQKMLTHIVPSYFISLLEFYALGGKIEEVEIEGNIITEQAIKELITESILTIKD